VLTSQKTTSINADRPLSWAVKEKTMYINLTKHPINIYAADAVQDGIVLDGKCPILTIPAGDIELRALYKEETYEHGGVPVKTKNFVSFNSELPESGDIIVSFQCVAPLRDRADLNVFTVDGIVKSSSGITVGCTSLVLNKR
jgi:hypothetical protein